jgi:predicted PhzF superfamily epimerase YddE/YHI9
VQECAAGLVRVRVGARDGLAFAAPPLLRSGPVDEPTIAEFAGVLRTPRRAIVDAAWADNGPRWVALLLASAEAVAPPAHLRHDAGRGAWPWRRGPTT